MARPQTGPGWPRFKSVWAVSNILAVHGGSRQACQAVPDQPLLKGGEYDTPPQEFTLFSLYASTDERFVKNGPIQIYSFGCPYVGGLTFYETFRHQEKARKIQVGRFFNTRDSISHLPVSWTGQYQHVGVSVRLPRVRPQFRAFIPEYLPRPSYPKDATRFGFYLRALRENYFFNLPFPWKIRKRHSLDEHQKRMLRARALCGLRKDRNGNEIQNQTLNDLYVALVYKDDA